MKIEFFFLQHNVRKRKLEDEQTSVYGVVTNAVEWHFYRYTRGHTGPRIEKFVKNICFGDEERMAADSAEILKIIVKILQSEINKNSNNSKRLRQDGL